MQIVRAIDKGPRLLEEPRLVVVEGVAVAEGVRALDAVDHRTQALR